MSVQIDIRHSNTVTVVDLRGRVTLGEEATALRDALRQIAKEGHKNVLLNLNGITYLDSSGLGLLVSSFATITNAGGRLKLVNLNARVKDLLLITKLYAVFEIFDDEVAAAASFFEPAVAAGTRS